MNRKVNAAKTDAIDIMPCFQLYVHALIGEKISFKFFDVKNVTTRL